MTVTITDFSNIFLKHTCKFKFYKLAEMMNGISWDKYKKVQVPNAILYGQ